MSAWRPRTKRGGNVTTALPPFGSPCPKVKAVLPYPIITDDGITGTRLSGVSVPPDTKIPDSKAGNQTKKTIYDTQDNKITFSSCLPSAYIHTII